ncbi:uroporphyrinogen-III C-methyltransferase [Nakamurella sp. PAMC28650]|uniref:uroporphyrinogen-III C-methyltransferase n=1 Tax=Nakamurella sp. PAMC28650 TaxID=2762325 RepID=UPI00164D6FE6|nr:uroporphyrinogen-III C-methyltransferase [Nakamurella sp. PAMC28650]QNK80035.1 uroporphyrinogen-III C-methyltransferase [Nakamurella sp. PAMC28650]
MSHPLVPLHLSLTGRPVVVIGGGPVAWRKVTTALDGGAVVTVVAPYVCDDLADAAAAGCVRWVQRDYLAGDVAGAWLAFAATGDADTDRAIEQESQARRVFCVRASIPDDPAHPGSRSPAVLRRGAVTVGVSTTDGADPRRAVAIKDAIGWAMDSSQLPLRRSRSGPGRVTLVGGGPGDVDLLTLAGRRALAEADVVVVDRLAPRGVLAELGPTVLVVEVGKAPGHHMASQGEINQVLVEHANAGRLVVRLKGGDPFIFGRGAEEMAACRDAGIEVTVIPGVSSAFAVPLAAGIPVTHRRMARQVTVLTGHDEDGMIRANWPALATGDGTLVVLMGVAALPTMTDELLCHGMDPGTPVAVIERGCSAAQRVTVGRLCTIADLARRRGVVSPAVIVIGAVASFARDTEIPTRDGEIPTHDRRSAI